MTKQSPRIIILVAHGLNLRPERMEPICEALRERGATAVPMTLRGHAGNYEELVGVNRSAWLEDFAGAEKTVVRIAQESVGRSGSPGNERSGVGSDSGHAAKIGFLGQSLGALAFADYLLHSGSRSFSGAFFLSPAIALRAKSHIMRVAKIAPRRVPVPSASDPSDRVYPRLPGGAYRALFESYTCVRRALRHRTIDLPTSITCHPDDELVSMRGLKGLIADGRLSNARLTPLSREADARGFRHVAVDEETMGSANWKRFETLLDTYLTSFCTM